MRPSVSHCLCALCRGSAAPCQSHARPSWGVFEFQPRPRSVPSNTKRHYGIAARGAELVFKQLRAEGANYGFSKIKKGGGKRSPPLPIGQSNTCRVSKTFPLSTTLPHSPPSRPEARLSWLRPSTPCWEIWASRLAVLYAATEVFLECLHGVASLCGHWKRWADSMRTERTGYRRLAGSKQESSAQSGDHTRTLSLTTFFCSLFFCSNTHVVPNSSISARAMNKCPKFRFSNEHFYNLLSFCGPLRAFLLK